MEKMFFKTRFIFYVHFQVEGIDPYTYLQTRVGENGRLCSLKNIFSSVTM